jgi:hypothetical protein
MSTSRVFRLSVSGLSYLKTDPVQLLDHLLHFKASPDHRLPTHSTRDDYTLADAESKLHQRHPGRELVRAGAGLKEKGEL